MSKVIIDRSVKAVRIEVDSVTSACWLGHKFATLHRDLVEQDWNIVCYWPDDFPPVGPEQHVLDALVGLPWTKTTVWVDAIARWIKAPPRSQHPCCSSCPHTREVSA